MSARQLYLLFVEQGLALGRQPQLVGGGLVRSAGGWSEIKALQRIGSREKRMNGFWVAAHLSKVFSARLSYPRGIGCPTWTEKNGIRTYRGMLSEKRCFHSIAERWESAASAIQGAGRAVESIGERIGAVAGRNSAAIGGFDIGCGKDSDQKG
jgi:hypothetical protein